MLNFTKIDRNNPSKRGVMDRIKDFKEVYNVFDKNKASEQAERCIGCGDPYCHNKCPLHNIIPAWLKQTAENDLELAFNISNETSPFPEILGRICPHDVLCEGDCSLNDTHGAITIGGIETHISETGFDNGLVPKFSKNKVGKKVAVVGSGPAGISVATFLLRAGIDVDMYERANRAGGLLTYGIPGFKLDKHRVERRIVWLKDAGMQLFTNCEIGKDKSFEALEKDYDAVFIGIGATKGKYPGISGEKNSNVYLAMEFLTGIQQRNFEETPTTFVDVKGKNVVVIGGGDTAMDCVRTSVREGANSVKCLYRRDEANMPGSKKEVQNSKEEGVEFVFNVSPLNIDENGVSLIQTAMSEPDESGRSSVMNVEGSEYSEVADIIILALGFEQEVPSFIKNANLELDRWNGIKVNESFQTSNQKIYAGGDGVRGADLAVRAAADGKGAAENIIKVLINK
ncbi:MAG: glutamate synthase subunit beta [Epsilonproteobacteria bacterium]|nr:glutamate synthase subunit beta [Campylobacterota bacterium]